MKRLNALITLGVFLVAVFLAIALPSRAATVPPPGSAAESKSTSPRIVTFASSRVFTQDTRLDAAALPGYALIDLQYVVVGTLAANPFTLTLRHSNDASAWATGSDTFSTITPVTNSTDMTRTHLFGAFTTINVDVTNGNALTLTLIGLAR